MGLMLCMFVCLAAWWQEQKLEMGLSTRGAIELEANVNRLMYSLDNTPVSVVKDQVRFAVIMAAFHKYERTVRCVHVLMCILIDGGD